MMYVSRYGEELTLDEWVAKRTNFSECLVKQTPVGPYVVSTVWIGIAGEVFETMVFQDERPALELCWRYDSLLAAREGHEAVVALVTQQAQ